MAECRKILSALLPIPKGSDKGSVDIWDKDGTHASDKIKEAIIAWEGYENSPYNDSDNLDKANCTVGIGHKLHSGPCLADEFNIIYSDEQIQEWFSVDIAGAEADVRQYFQDLDNAYRPNQISGNPVPINQSQFDALVSFTYNAGPGNLAYLLNSTVQPNFGIENGEFNLPLFEDIMLHEFTSEPGLIPRRESEIILFVSGVYP